MGETTIEPREPGTDRRDNVVSAGLSPDTFEDFEDYRVENNIPNSSDALRRLVREGLDPHDKTLGQLSRASFVAGIAYLTVLFAVDAAAAGAVGGAYISALLIWSSYPKTVGKLIP